MKYILPFLMFTNIINGQTWADSTLSPYINYFVIENNMLVGDGAQMLEKAIEESQFLVFGERHYSAQISNLTTALIPIISKHGFNHFCAEVGPISAEILSEKTYPLDSTIQNMYTFNSKYSFEAYDDIPIPFFDGIEDAIFLRQIGANKIELHGIDQEYYLSTFHLIDRMFDNISKEHKIHGSYSALMDTSHIIHQKDMDVTNYNMFNAMQNNPFINQILHALVEANPKNKEIEIALRKTWDIYHRNAKRDGTSHISRVQYIRNNFNKIYHQDSTGKFFIKIGSLHAGSGAELGAYDLGDLTDQLAQKTGTKSTHIKCSSRYYKDGEELQDYSKYYQNAGYPFTFHQLGKRDRFTIIDLSTIRKDLKSGKLFLTEDLSYHEVRETIEKFDYFIILPEDREQIKNYTSN